jgi:hypothetical protein
MPNENPVSWTDLIHESVHTRNDEQLGHVEAVSRNFMVVKKGLVNVRRYYIPLTKVKGWDGRTVWLQLTDEQARAKYEKDRRPDPYVYHFSSAQQTETSDAVTDFWINMPTIDRTYEEEGPFLTAEKTPAEEPRMHMCDLCDAKFRSESELDEHVSTHHQ